MIGDISLADNIYIICGYTDYLRSIIIREDCCKVDTINYGTKIIVSDIIQGLFEYD
ncbi:MAG: hypothetical protein J6P79_03275 [Pseudobutyrivibrio sp.]|nr:hypothetical protein [Pseudobutyrivibrio sp.]